MLDDKNNIHIIIDNRKEDNSKIYIKDSTLNVISSKSSLENGRKISIYRQYGPDNYLMLVAKNPFNDETKIFDLCIQSSSPFNQLSCVAQNLAENAINKVQEKKYESESDC